MRKLYLLTVGILAVTASLVIFSARGSSEEGCVTEKCHATMLKGKDVHPVAQPCDTCHQAEMTPHPQKGKNTFKLTQDVPQLCEGCHQGITGTKKVVHPPVKSGMCTSCHNPHDSDNPKLLLQPVGSLCVSCHTDKTSFKVMHGPTSTGDCTVCHAPHESNNKSLLLKDGPDLCFTCHSDISEELKKKDVHPAILGGCTSCHNPHGSSAKKLLSAEGAQLCFQCHPQIEEKIEKAKVVHGPIKTERACASCHSPHASDGEKLLAKSGKDLCLDCHKAIIKKNMTVLHGPIRDGKCTPCHDPHGSPYSKLLVNEFPTDFYVPYNDKEFALCFMCHNRDLLRYPDTSFATGFRDGDRNLHYVHVNRKEKGRSCRACHALHGSENPKLIADKVSFGKWELPLKYVKTDTGGACSPGCHKPFNYDRKSPGRAPEPPKTPAPAKPAEKGK